MSTRLFAALLVLSPSFALADQPPTLRAEAPPPKKDRGEIQLAVKVGGLFSEPFSALGPSYLVDLELGYVLPVWRHHLAVSLEGAYTAPTADGKQSDARLDASGGSYAWHLEQREAILGVTFFYRHPIKRFIPYVGIGPRIFLLQTRVQGQAGASPIDLSTETSTKIGAGIPIGCGFVLGPGHLFAELGLILGNIDHTTTGNVAVGVSSITLALGYRLSF